MNTPMPQMDFSEKAINHKKFGTGASIVGSDFLFSLIAKSGTVSRGEMLEAIPINPRFWEGTRLKTVSRLWNRYCYGVVVLEYVPVVSSLAQGAIQIYPDYDVDGGREIEVGDAGIRYGLAHQNCEQGQVFSYIRSVFRNSDMTESYFCGVDGDARLENQAMIYIQAASDFTIPDVTAGNEVVLGNIIAHYECNFYLRALEESNQDFVRETRSFELQWSTFNASNNLYSFKEETPIYLWPIESTVLNTGDILWIKVRQMNTSFSAALQKWTDSSGREVVVQENSAMWGRVIAATVTTVDDDGASAIDEYTLIAVFSDLNAATEAPIADSFTEFDRQTSPGGAFFQMPGLPGQFMLTTGVSSLNRASDEFEIGQLTYRVYKPAD